MSETFKSVRGRPTKTKMW